MSTTATLSKPYASSARFAMERPVLTGDTVTQGHADYCRDNGHAYYIRDGVRQSFCPRCGDSTATPLTLVKVPASPVLSLVKVAR